MADIDSIRELLSRGPEWLAEGQRLEAALAEAEIRHRSLMEGLGDALAAREKAETALIAWYSQPGAATLAVIPGATWPADVESARRPVAIEAPLVGLRPDLFSMTGAEEEASGHWDFCHWSGGLEGLAEAARAWSDGQLEEALQRFTKSLGLPAEAKVVQEEQQRRFGPKKKPVAKKKPPPPPDPALAVPCIRCRAPADSPCKNYKGQRKATCTERGKESAPESPPADEPVFPAWKDNRLTVDGPDWVLSVHEDTPQGVFEATPLTTPFGAWGDPNEEHPTPTEHEIAGAISRVLGRPVEVAGVSWDCKGVPTFALRQGPPPGTTHYGHDASTFREEVKEWSDAQIAKELEHPRITAAEQLILLDEQMERKARESKARVSKKKASEPPKAETPPLDIADLELSYPGAKILLRGSEWCRFPAAEDPAVAEEFGVPESFKNSHLDEHVHTLLAAGRDVVVIDTKTGNEYPLFDWSADGEFSVDVDGQKVNCLWRVKAQEDHAAGALVLTGPADLFASRGYLRVLVKKEDQYGHPETQARVCVADYRSTQRKEVPA